MTTIFDEFQIAEIAHSFGCHAEVVHHGSQMSDNPRLSVHAQTVREREEAQADARFMTVAQLQEGAK